MTEPAATGAMSLARPTGWQLLRANRAAWISFWILIILTLTAFVMPPFMPEILKHTSDFTFLAPFVRDQAGNFHLMGTDLNGQDLFYRVLSGARVSLTVGWSAALVSLITGTAYGVISGYVGGKVDAWMMRVLDLIYSIPRLLFIMIFVSVFDPIIKKTLDTSRIAFEKSGSLGLAEMLKSFVPYSKIFLLILSLGLIAWLTMARIIRGQVLALKEQQFITAARAMGQSHWGIIRLHLLPNLSTIILTYLTLTIPSVILDESFLSFLGLGIDDPAASLGSLLKDGAGVINVLDNKWWLLAFPATMLSLSLLSLNFLGDGLRDAFDPRSGK